jgi:hypothetical protein
MLQIDDIGEILKENLRSIQIECEMLEKIRPGQQRSEWVLGVRQRIAAAEKLLTITETRCLNDVVMAGNVQIDSINQLVEQIKETARQFPYNQLMQIEALYMEKLRRDSVEMLTKNAGMHEAVIIEQFRQLRVEVKYLAVKTKSL